MEVITASCCAFVIIIYSCLKWFTWGIGVLDLKNKFTQKWNFCHYLLDADGMSACAAAFSGTVEADGACFEIDLKRYCRHLFINLKSSL